MELCCCIIMLFVLLFLFSNQYKLVQYAFVSNAGPHKPISSDKTQFHVNRSSDGYFQLHENNKIGSGNTRTLRGNLIDPDIRPHTTLAYIHV